MEHEVSIGMDERALFLIYFAFLILMAVLMVTVSMSFRFKSREMQHRERLVAIEKGLALPAEEVSRRAPWSPRTFMLRGLIWLFTGIGLTIFLFGLSLTTRNQGIAFRVNQAAVAKSNGASEAQVQQIMDDKESQGLPIGVALIGLIPMGVGLAFLVAYRAEKTQESKLARVEAAPVR